MSQNFLQTGMTLAFLKLLSVRPQLKQGLKTSRVHIPTCKSMDAFHAWWENNPRVMLRRPQNKSSMYETKNQNNNLKFRIVVVKQHGHGCEVLGFFSSSIEALICGAQVSKCWHYQGLTVQVSQLYSEDWKMLNTADSNYFFEKCL